MVGSFSVVASSMTDLHACPCLCLDVVPSCNLGIGDPNVNRSLVTRKPAGGSLELSSSFLDSVKGLSSSFGSERLRVMRKKKSRSFTIVSEVAGQYEEGFADVKTQILNYFTYKAVRTVLHQLYEMNPPRYRWFYNYVVNHKPHEGKKFLRSLQKEERGLAERVMITRLHLYSKWIKKCDHAAIYQEISDQNLELMRERLMETVIWPSDDTNTEKIG